MGVRCIGQKVLPIMQKLFRANASFSTFNGKPVIHCSFCILKIYFFNIFCFWFLFKYHSRISTNYTKFFSNKYRVLKASIFSGKNDFFLLFFQFVCIVFFFANVQKVTTSFFLVVSLSFF